MWAYQRCIRCEFGELCLLELKSWLYFCLQCLKEIWIYYQNTTTVISHVLAILLKLMFKNTIFFCFTLELNNATKTFFTKEYLKIKQSFQKSSCAKWPLPSCRKALHLFGGKETSAKKKSGNFVQGLFLKLFSSFLRNVSGSMFLYWSILSKDFANYLLAESYKCTYEDYTVRVELERNSWLNLLCLAVTNV